MEPQAEATTIYPIPDDLDSPISSSYSVYDSFDIGNLTDATDDNSTAATTNADIGNLTDFTGFDWDDDFWEDFNRNGSGNATGGGTQGTWITMETADYKSMAANIDIGNRDFIPIVSGNVSDGSTTMEEETASSRLLDDHPLFRSLPRNENEGEDAAAIAGNEYYSVSNLMEDLGQGSNKLSWKAPAASTGSKTSLWVFWTNPLLQTFMSSLPSFLHGRIKTVLVNFRVNSSAKILAQFWEPKIIAGRRVLTTLDQPFGGYGIDREFAAYRKQCLDYKIDVDSEIEDNLGLPGRVFRNKWPEFNSDVKLYSIQEYPLRDSAVLCGVKRSLALPIFARRGPCCVGVLEIVDAEENDLFVDVLAGVHLALKVAELGSSYMYFNAEMQKCPSHTSDEIQRILVGVGATHKLPLAQTWVISNFKNAVNPRVLKSGKVFRRKLGKVASSYGMPYYEHDGFQTFDFRMSCKEHIIRKDQGVVGKVLLDFEPRFCIDVAQLSPTGYPFAICARNSRLSACLAVCLNNIKDVNEVYVLEFFLPPCNAQIPETLLLSILTTMREHLWNFKIYGEQGDNISIEVIELPLTNEVESFKPNINGISAASSEIQKGVEEQLDPGIQVIKDSSAVIMNNVESNATVTCLRRTYSGANSSERKQEAAEISISFEVLKQQFGMKLEDAADSLGVSRSTLKRICRKHDISRWPSSSRKKGNHSLASSSAKSVSELGIKYPSSSTPPPKEVTTAIMPLEDTSCVTVKALYRKDIIRFRLSLSSGMAELVDNVTKRLNLEVRTLVLKFEDDDGDMVLLTCDEDLQECFRCSRLRGTDLIKISIEQDTNQAP